MAMRECIILSGGLGTRLQHLLPDTPKALAPIRDTPFLTYIIQYLIDQKVNRFIFSLGHLHEKIEEFIHTQFPHLDSVFIIEQEALGTGGAIAKACEAVQSDNYFVINADTYYPIDFDALENFHVQSNSPFTIALKPFIRPDRYGTVQFQIDGRITQFLEKKQTDFGFINGGIYCVSKNLFTALNGPKVFSLEKEVFEQRIQDIPIYAQVHDEFFIDIGIPEDYYKAQNLLSDLERIPKPKKSLILDRDGVINVKLDGYVTKVEEFKFIPGFLESIKKIAEKFDYLFIVTNQQGIGKGIMSETDLETLHQFMQAELLKHDIQMDKIYYCPHLEMEYCNCRKPQPGMLDNIKLDFPDMSFQHAVLIGDMSSDMKLAKSRNIFSILLSNDDHPATNGNIQLFSWKEIEEYLNKFWNP